MTTVRGQTVRWAGAVMILAVGAFVLAFALEYWGSPRQPGPGPSLPSRRLTFPVPVFPPEGEPPQPLLDEVKRPSSHDFWFENHNEDGVQVGLVSRSCQCSRVELFLVPHGQTPPLRAYAAGQLAAAAPTGVGGDPALALTGLGRLAGLAIAQEGKTGRVLGDRLEGLPLTLEESRLVPPGAIGWVRLHWAVDKPGDRRLGVELWTDHRQAEATLLQAQVRVVPPLLALPEIDVGTVDAGSLPRTVAVDFGSPTRPSLAAEVRVVRDGRSPKADTLVPEGEPVRLGEAECRALEVHFPGIRLACGYRIRVKLLDVSEDGTTPFELGRFRRYLRVDAGEGAEQLVALEGLVRGDVRVGAPQEGGLVVLPPFPASKGTEYRVVVQSDVPGLDLEVDTTRGADFLEARLEKPKTAPSGHRIWHLIVNVLPNKVHGPFPSADDPALRDSAVYLKRKAGPPRTIRIPVRGTATSGSPEVRGSQPHSAHGQPTQWVDPAEQ
jgi:hypothetical protein